MNDPMVLFAFVIIYLATGFGLMAFAGGFRRHEVPVKPRNEPIPFRRREPGS